MKRFEFAAREFMCLIAACAVVASGAVRAAEPDADPELRAVIEADWTAQERRLGRAADSAETLRAILLRTQILLGELIRSASAASFSEEIERLRALEAEVAQAPSLDPAARLALYHRMRWLGRGLMLKNPLFPTTPVVFVKRHRFVFQMLHEYLGYYYNYAGLAGGGISVLERPGRSLALRELAAGRLPPGSFTTPAVSYDGRTIYFAFAEVRSAPGRSSEGNWTKLKPAFAVAPQLNYFGAQRSTFHLYSLDLSIMELRQLTEGPNDDFNPCPLPDGGLAFLSTRRGGFCRCGGDVEPVPTYTLHRLERDGRLRTLSVHETNEWHPSVLCDGRIVYSRWDYVDRSAAHFHGLWTCNPDGSDPRVVFGNYTKRLSACYQPRAVPGSGKIAMIVGAHHADVGGSLVLVDPPRARLDASSGEDLLDCLDVVTPEVCFPEAPSWPKSYYGSPWPLSEKFFLVAASFEPLAGWGSKVKQDGSSGIYWLDRFGNLELLYREPGIACSDPIPLVARPAPPAIPSTLDAALGDEGELLLSNVQWSLLGLPEARPIKSLRVFQVLPKTTHVADQPLVGHARQASARMLLGTVPVEADGSAYFRAPAGRPLYFQAVDASGRAVAGMRSVTYLQSGERRGCVGCHEPPATAPATRQPQAALRAASVIEPGPEGTRPFSFPLLVQPVLDRHCLPCHDGRQHTAADRVVLTSEAAGPYTRSYQSLEPHVAWYSWLGRSIGDIVTRPGQLGADSSPLLKVLEDANHSKAVRLPDDDRRRLLLWLDANVPFYGTYDPEAQQAQRAGRKVPPPALQ